MDSKMITVMIVDDHAVVRQGLRSFLELQDDLEVVGEASNGLQAVDMAAKLHPDVILMDMVMPEMDGVTDTRKISEQGLGVKVLALTSFAEEERVVPAIQAGAAGYLLKDVSPDALAEAIRATARGETRLHPDAARTLMQQVTRKPAEPVPDALTERELEVLRLVARGMSNQAIANELFISDKTVKTHVSSLLSKLNLEDRTQLAIYAINKGLVSKSSS
jgi:two-component system, NarL family, response regulator LiaR